MLENNYLILVIDDDPLITLAVEAFFKKEGHTLLSASDGKSALALLKEHNVNIDVVVLDRRLPDQDGLEIVQLMKNNNELKKIPIIILSGADSPVDIRTGIESGAYYYLPKPMDLDIMHSIIVSALLYRDRRRAQDNELRRLGSCFSLIELCEFKIQTLTQAEALAAFIANLFPDHERVATGLAALLINAIEHGNCSIGYETKGVLLQNGTWREEIDRRTNLPENKDKFVAIRYWRQENGHSLTITDQGNGFDWRKYLYLDPGEAIKPYGRSIATANSACFDRLSYNEKGNEATIFVGADKPIDW